MHARHENAALHSQYFTDNGPHVLCFWKSGELPGKQALVTLIATVNHELAAEPMGVRGNTFSMENSALLIFILARIIRC